MGRSVSYASNSEHIAYSHTHQDAYYCSSCGDTFDEYASREARVGDYEFYSEEEEQEQVQCCPHCKAHNDECSEQDPSDDWDFYKRDFQRQMRLAFPSLETCDEWVDREDHALLENQYAYFGVSEYCGLVSMWVQPKDTPYRENDSWGNRRDHWISQIGRKFYKTAGTCFGTALNKVGTFSNGESFYQAA